MSAIPELELTPDELLTAARDCKDLEELRTLGNKVFAPWIEGDVNPDYLKNQISKLGYQDVYKTLIAEQGIVKGKNSDDGKYHIIQHLATLATRKNKKRSLAQAKHTSDSGVIDVDRYINTTIKLLQSTDAPELAIGIAAATGRRPYEVVVYGAFSEEKEPANTSMKDVNPSYVYHFKNPAKKRDYELDEKPEFASTSLVMAEDLLKAVRTLRSHVDVKELRDDIKAAVKGLKGKDRALKQADTFNDLWSHKLVKATRDCYSFLPGKPEKDGNGRKEVTAQDLRPAYAQVSAIRDVPRDDLGQPLRLSEILFKGMILGHYIEDSAKGAKLESLTSTLNYYGYKVDSKPTYTDRIFELAGGSIHCTGEDKHRFNNLAKEYGKTQKELFGYLLESHQQMRDEILFLKQQLRAKPQPAKEQPKMSQQSEIMGVLQSLQQQIDELKRNQSSAAEETAYPAVETPPIIVKEAPKPAAVTPVNDKTDTAPKVSSRQVKAFQWLDMVTSKINDHNTMARGDKSQMWAYSPRLLKDVSKVSQSLVSKFWEQESTELLARNEGWELDEQHNRRRGMKGNKVTDNLNLTRPDDLK